MTRRLLVGLLSMAACGDAVDLSSAPVASRATAAMQRAGQPVITTIDVPNALGTAIDGINAAGDMVGRFTDLASHDHGFLLRDGHFTQIDVPGNVFFTAAAGISATGDVVGNFRLKTEASAVRHGFLLSHGTFTTIDYPGAIFTNALGINSQGDIVGRYMISGGVFHGYLLREGVFTTIDVPGAVEANAWGINAAGEIVGDYRDANNAFHVFMLGHGAAMSIDYPGAFATAPFPLVALGGLGASGDVASTYCDATPCLTSSVGHVHAFVLSNGQFTSFDAPGAITTFGFGMNARGDVVGVYVDAAQRTHGFLRSSR